MNIAFILLGINERDQSEKNAVGRILEKIY